ncbi:hypothetical protein [Sphingomonas endolithica]|uniref:hypothetical protein n=1 Tax=Sphingomonas endolithica TaxID=2972485 RepID=UPI0021AE7668|nr:hypothetical protein [Sphingomonas sp. ZFBP2030]
MLTASFAMAGMVVHPLPEMKFVAEARVACAAPVGKRPKIKGIRIERVIASAGDLPKLRITDVESGGWMYAYYDATSERAAWARAACLGAQLRLLDAELSGARRSAQWYGAVFAAVAAYVPPASETVTRWHVPIRSDGALLEEGQDMVVLTMPHEQLHGFQMRAGAQGPRWFSEGHAEWLSRSVKQAIAPAAAQKDALGYEADLAAATMPVALESWGGLKIKREAIFRQVSKEERRKMEADLRYYPPMNARSFKFGPNDLTGDESDPSFNRARYEAAWRTFRDLEAAHGKAAVQRWVMNLTSQAGSVPATRIKEEAQSQMGEDLSARLK